MKRLLQKGVKVLGERDEGRVVLLVVSSSVLILPHMSSLIRLLRRIPFPSLVTGLKMGLDPILVTRHENKWKIFSLLKKRHTKKEVLPLLLWTLGSTTCPVAYYKALGTISAGEKEGLER